MECWSVGVLECWSVGVLECWSVGVLECWSVGVLECWSVGVLECWSVELLPFPISIVDNGELRLDQVKGFCPVGGRLMLARYEVPG